MLRPTPIRTSWPCSKVAVVSEARWSARARTAASARARTLLEAITALAPAEADPKMLAEVVSAALLTVALTSGLAMASTVTSPVAWTTLFVTAAATANGLAVVPAMLASIRALTTARIASLIV